MKRIIFTTIFVLMIMATQSHAEVIYLRNGRVIKGEIVSQNTIYIRLKPRYGSSEREFLVDNVLRIEDGKKVVFQREVLDIFENSNIAEAPVQLKIAAKEMAVALLEEAMRNVEIQSLENTPDNVKIMAHQKATNILEETMANLDEAPKQVKKAAKDMANALIEETVREESVTSLSDAPYQVREAAQEKAAFLIEEAMAESVGIKKFGKASKKVKQAARDRAQALISEAMLRVDVLDKVISEGKEISENYDGESEREVVTNSFSQVGEDLMERYNSPEKIDLVKNNLRVIDLTGDGRIEEIIEEEIMEADTKVSSSETILAALAANSADAMGEVSEKKERVSYTTIPLPEVITSKQMFLNVLTGLGIKDFGIMGVCVVLLLVLLGIRIKPKEEKFVPSKDLSVASSVTFQHLPDDIKLKFTSSDVSLIIGLEDRFMQELTSKSKDDVEFDNEQIVKYIQEQAAIKGSKFVSVDIQKVLDTEEKSLKEAGIA